MLGITYSEFDNIVGPQLQYSYPPGILSAETFETLSDYAIVGSHLCNKCIIVRTEQIQFMSYSAAINQKKYFRNTLTFSCGVVLDRDADTEPYEPLLRKLSLALQAMELEQELLFKKSTKDKRLPQILRDLYESIADEGEAFIEMDKANYLAIKLFTPPTEPRTLGEYEVPMLRWDRQLTSNLPWDISLQHIIPQINGINNIKTIADESDMDIGTVMQSMRILLFYRCIIMTSTFRFNNIYKMLPDAARKLNSDPKILTELEEFSLVLPADMYGGDALPRQTGLGSNTGGTFTGAANNPNATFGLGASFSENNFSEDSERTLHDDVGVTVNSGVDMYSEFGARVLSSTAASESTGNLNAYDGAASSLPPVEKPPSRIPGILRFLFRLRPGRTVAQAIFGENYKQSSGPNGNASGNDGEEGLYQQVNLSNYLTYIDIRRLLAIAQERGIVQRLYEFPVRGTFGGDSKTSACSSADFDTLLLHASDAAAAAAATADKSRLGTSMAADARGGVDALRGMPPYYPYGDYRDDDYEAVRSKEFDSEPTSKSSRTATRRSSGTGGKGLVKKETKKRRSSNGPGNGNGHAKTTQGGNPARRGGAGSVTNKKEEEDEEELFMADLDEQGGDEVRNGADSDVEGSEPISASDDSNGSDDSSYIGDHSDGSVDEDTDTVSHDESGVSGESMGSARRNAELIMSTLHGGESMDELCSAFQISPALILQAPHVFIALKTSTRG